MATLTGSSIASTYTQLLKITSATLGADASAKYIEDGAGTDSALSISTTRVGIGTASPENKLHVQQSALFAGTHSTAGIRIKSDGASGIDNYHGTIALSKGTGSVAISAVQEASDADVMGMAFFTHPSTTGGDAAVEQMRIDSAGNVGIGGSPSELLHLIDASSSMNIVLDNSGGTGIIPSLQLKTDRPSNGQEMGKISWFNNNSTAIVEIKGERGTSDVLGDLVFKTATINRMRIDEDGNVGIGTDSPSGGAVGGKVLHLVNSGGTASVRVQRSDATTAGTLSITSGNGSNSIYSTGNKPLNIYTNSTTRMTIDGSGNVGIGTDDPKTLIHLAPGGNTDGIQVGGTTSNRLLISDREMTLQRSTTSTVGLKLITKSDGTWGAGDGGDIIFEPDETEALRIATAGDVTLSSGNLVIGTAGKGIDFDGNSRTAVLDDYEEGTWTPVINGNVTVGSGTYSLQSGAYTKVGNRVFLSATITWTDHTGAGSGIRIGGFPVNSGGTGSGEALTGYIYNVALTSGSRFVSANVRASDDEADWFQQPTSGGAIALIPFDTAGTCSLSGSYIV